MSDLDTLLAMHTAARKYKLGEVPASPVYPYVVLSLDTGEFINRRVGGGSTRKANRLVVQHFGRSDDAVRDMAARSDAAYEAKVLPLAGSPFSTREVAAAMVRDPDDAGVLGVIHTYKF